MGSVAGIVEEVGRRRSAKSRCIGGQAYEAARFDAVAASRPRGSNLKVAATNALSSCAGAVVAAMRAGR